MTTSTPHPDAGRPDGSGRPVSAGVAALLAALALILPGEAASAHSVGQRVDAVAADTAGLEVLRHELRRIAEHLDGTVGAGLVHLETGRSLFLNGNERFPMASTYKVPIAVQFLSRVQRREVRLDSMVELRPADLHPGSGTLTALFDDPGVELSLHNLFELMLLISDNSGTDLVLQAAGGAEAVTSRMRDAGLYGIRVDRSTERLIADWVGIGELPPEERRGPASFGALYESVTEDEREAAGEAFRDDPRDTATPRDMARLLTLLWDGELLDEERTELLLDTMRRCETGDGRIKGILPPGTVVAHKTGTIGGTTNDVGIVELPDGRGHVVAALFVKGSEDEVEVREAAIAQVARAAYGYFLFNSGEVAGRSLPRLEVE